MPLLNRKPKAKDSEPRRRKGDEPHPVRMAITTIGSIAVVIGFVYVLEDRYAHAGDVTRLQGSIQQLSVETKQGQEINRLTAEVAVLTIQKSLSEQQLDAIAARKQSGPDQINMDRVKARIAAYDSEIAAKQRLIDRLKAGR